MPLRTVKILCFGDSFTCGYTSGGSMFHPYAHTMMKTLRMAFPEVKLDINVKGVSGDSVLEPGSFYNRLKSDWEDSVKRQEPYDWVLILGGTNDLPALNPTSDPDDGGKERRSAGVQKIFSELVKLYDFCLASGAKVIGMTVPETAVKIGWLDDARNELNRAISSHAKNNPNFHVFDLHRQIPFNKNSPENQALWDDGIHLTTKGYSAMGCKLANFFLSLLADHIDKMPTTTLASTSAVAAPGLAAIARADHPPPPLGIRRPVDPAENDVFEEESGDPNVLSQGYVFVRRRDLD